MKNWQDLWRQHFRHEPSADTVHAMDAMVRLCSPHLDDPFMIIAMYFQYQIQIFSDRTALFIIHAGELERAAMAVRGASNDVRNDSGLLLDAAAHVENTSTTAHGEMEALAATVVGLRRFVEKAVHDLHHASQRLAAENSRWRMDLSLLFIVILTASVSTNVMFAVKLLFDR